MIFICALLAWSNATVAVEQQNPAAKIIRSNCKSCHGEDGIAKVESWPNLSCQNRGYLYSRLLHLQNNDEHAVDDGIKQLSISDIDYISHYYAEQPCTPRR
jgi:cytochrome c553